ncbi:MAG: hypothetical protein J5950_05785 [Clostridia bacterium]|nr:hypothetical protein [Clostridia bacterium]
MKKRIVLISVFTLVLALALSACDFRFNFGGEGNDPPLSRNDGTDTNVYVNGGNSLNPPDPSDVSPSDDGAQFGGKWPDNEYTRQLPKPDFSILAATDEDGSFDVVFTGVTIDQIKAYVEKVKASGFTRSAEVQDENIMGMTIFAYTAENSEGYSVSISFTAGTAAMSVSKAF